MGYVAKLVRGAEYLDLSSGRYSLGRDFKPGVSSFSVKVSGSSSAEVRKGVDDINLFLSYCGDTARPTYFEWAPDSNVSSQTGWGQGLRRVELLGGALEYWDEYFEASVRDAVAFVKVSLEYGSVAEGVRQLCATATGGIVEDWIGMPDGQSRGLHIPEGDATNGNRFTNPVFGHATYNTGWTAGTSLTVEQNTDPAYIVYGLNSVKITANTSPANTFTQAIDAGSLNPHVLSCYAKLPNSGSIGTAHLQLYYGTVISTGYTSVGEGWYRCLGTPDAELLQGGTVNVGVAVTYLHSVYLDAFQLEQHIYPTAFFYGDMLGCAWAGTPHASKSTRTAAKVTFPIGKFYNMAAGSIRVIWTSDAASSTYPAESFYLFDTTGTPWLGYNGLTVFAWASTGLSYDDTFPAGETFVFHLVWDQEVGMSLYINGILVDSSIYAIWNPGANLFIGTQDDGTNHINGTFNGFKMFYGYGMTAAEVAADYANVMQVSADGQCVDSIPYVWTKDGDNVVDNVDSGDNQNWAVIGGVPGDLSAKVEASLVTGGMNDADVYLSRLDVPYNYWLDPEFLTYATQGTISVTTTNVGLATIGLDNDEFRIVAGRKLGVMVRGVEGTANNITLRTGINPGGAYYYTAGLPANWGTAGGTATRIDMSPEIFMVDEQEFYRVMGYYCNDTAVVQGVRSSGTANFILNAAQIMPYPLTRFSNLSASGTTATIAYIDGKAYEVSGSALYYTYQVKGAPLELQPNRYNLLTNWLGAEGSLSEPADTLTYSAVYVTPKWKML